MILFETVSFVAANLKNLKKLAANGYTWVQKKCDTQKKKE